MGTKISELVSGSPAAVLTGAEGLELTQSGNSVGALASQLRDYVDSSIAERTGVEFTVPTLSSLKALTTRPSVVTVKTGQAAGQWQWEEASSTTADDALVVEPTSGTAGRYKRIYDGVKLATWWGATGDGVTNDGAALVAAMATGGDLKFPDGDYVIDGFTLEPLSGARLHGPGRLVKTDTVVAVETLFLCENVDDVQFIGLKGRLLDGFSYFVYTLNSTRIKVIDCLAGEDGELWAGGVPVFFAKDSIDCEATGNIIYGGQAGVATGGDPLNGSGSAFGTCRKIAIRENNINYTQLEAIDINWDTQSFQVIGNYGVNIGTRGDADNECIDVGGDPAQADSVCRDGEVSGNIFYCADTSGNAPGQQNGVFGLTLKYCINVKCSNNEFYGTGQASTVGCWFKGGGIEGCSVDNSIFDDFAKGCVYGVASDRTHFRNNELTEISDIGVTVSTAGTPGGFHDNSQITGNTIIAKSAATGSGMVLTNARDFDLSGSKISGFLSTTAGQGRAIDLASTHTNTKGRANNVAISDCDEGIVTTTPLSVIGGEVSNCTVYGLDVAADDITVNGLSLVDNVAGGGGQFNARFQSGSDRLSITSLTCDDTRGPALARGVQFLGGANCYINGIFVPRFLASSIAGLNNLTDSIILGVGSACAQSATIATGAITVQNGVHTLITLTAEGGVADDLDTATYTGKTGDKVTFKAVNSTVDITLKDGTGNLRLNGDFVLNNLEDTLTAMWTGSFWQELSRSDNGA